MQQRVVNCSIGPCFAAHNSASSARRIGTRRPSGNAASALEQLECAHDKRQRFRRRNFSAAVDIFGGLADRNIRRQTPSVRAAANDSAYKCRLCAAPRRPRNRTLGANSISAKRDQYRPESTCQRFSRRRSISIHAQSYVCRVGMHLRCRRFVDNVAVGARIACPRLARHTLCGHRARRGVSHRQVRRRVPRLHRSSSPLVVTARRPSR